MGPRFDPTDIRGFIISATLTGENCMRHTKTAFFLAGLTMLGASTVQAADTTFGFQLTVASPQSDLDKYVDGKIGYGAGIHALVDMSDGHAIVPRLDYMSYSRSNDSYDAKFSALNIGADYNYYISRRAGEGFYVLAGLGYSSGKFESDYLDYSVDETKGALYLQAGLGYSFTKNFGAELRYQHASYSFEGTDRTAPSIQASFTVRF
jgi:hypothetical protein